MALMELIGKWAFIVGMVVAIVGGFWWGPALGIPMVWALILVIVGLVVGFLNITTKESKDFLLTVLILVVIAKFGAEVFSMIETTMLGAMISGILNALMIFVVPAGVIVAFRNIWGLAKD